MKRIALLATALALLASLVVGSAVGAAGPDGASGESNVGHLYLYQKDPSSWAIVDGGAWGKLLYSLSGPTFQFVFNGRGLTANTSYSLIYYADPWPGNNPGALIGSGSTNSSGDIRLKGDQELNTDLPNPNDANYPTGAKIWLVLSSDYDAANKKMVGWNPTSYLFENNLITYNDYDFVADGFDQFGYNYQAMVFVGKADGVDRNLDGTVWGDATYANDHLVMKWSQGWDAARFHGAPWGPDAWEDNEWNGMAPDGSASVWHYKVIWVGPELTSSPYWREGGYAIWGQFEVIMDQGLDPNFGPGHFFLTLAIPNGFGGPN